MRVTLINPPGGYYAARWEESALPSLGLGYLAAYLERHGFECEILDAHAVGWKLSDVASRLRESRPDVVGVTFSTENRFTGFETIRAAKSALPDALIIAGGPHVSAAAEDTLRNLPELDLVVRGEGEETLLEIAQRLQDGRALDDILGVSCRGPLEPSPQPSPVARMHGRGGRARQEFLPLPSMSPGTERERVGVRAPKGFCRAGAQIIENPARPFLQDLDQLPFPARHLMPMECYRFAADVPGEGRLPAQNIMASRGCPFNCSFCASAKMWGRRYRARSPENVLSEVAELVHRYGTRALWVFDDTFTVERSRTAAICEGLAERFPGLRWFCEIRVDTVDRELLALMKRAGCFCVAFGVESGSQRIIDESIGKRIRLEQVDQVVSWCRDLSLQYNPFMILSHPGETEEDARKSMQLVRRWKEDGATVSLAIMHIYPGTRIESVARENGLLPPDFSWTSKADARRVPMLPAAQGDVPIFLDKLSWDFLSGCLFEWARMQGYSVFKRIPKALAGIRSFSDVKRYWAMLRVYVGRARWQKS